MARAPLHAHLPRAAGALAALLIAGDARAQSADESARAERLFTEAMGLIESGNYAEACPKLEASERMDPALGTQFNLALCEEKIGRYARAWRNFTAVEKLAHASGKRGREEAARDRLAELRPRVPHLVIATVERDVTVRLDGEVIERDLFGFVAVEGGTHTLEAIAAAKQRWSQTLSVEEATDGRGTAISIAIPALKSAPIVTRDRVVTREVTKETASGKRTAAYVLGGVGLVGVATGILTGVLVASAKSTAEASCTPTCADQSGRDAVSTGKALLPVNTAAWAAGAIGLGAGGVLWFLSRRAAPATPAPRASVSPLIEQGAGGLVLRGAF